MFTEIAQVVGVIEIFESRWITSELFVVGANRPRILHAAMDQFFFAFPPQFKLNGSGCGQGEYAHQGNHQKQSEKHIAILLLTNFRGRWPFSEKQLHWNANRTTVC